MDPIQNALASMLNALQAASAAAPEVAAPNLPALLALVGQDVNLLLLGAGPDGPRLALPSGQAFTAQGGMPYPDGTELLVRVLGGMAEPGTLRLQTLEAHPPPPAPILAPLLQGEGAALQARLGQAEPPPGLADLATRYLALQAEAPPGAVGPAGGLPAVPVLPAPGTPTQVDLGVQAQTGPGFPALAGRGAPADAAGPALVLPDRPQLQAALDLLPAPAAAALKALLPPTPGGSVTEALETWLAQGAANPTPGRTPVQEVLQRFQTLVERHPELPPAPALTPFLKAVAPREAEQRPAPAPARTGGTVPASLPAPATARAGPGLPETWQSWIKSVVKTLGDPATSPREAPFHAAQAKEGTAFYEVPLPWAPQSPLQVWVEQDRKGQGGGGQEETRTILVGLKFSRLGETRLGVARGPAGLQVRVWTERPELLAAAQDAITRELETLGPAVDLRILPLQPGPGGFVPSLRSLVTGPTMQILG